MSLEVKIPAVGESITEVTIAKWLKNDGDIVERDELLCELESDKATFELNAESAGKIKILVKEGETVEIGAVICSIDTDSAAPAKEEKKEEKSTSAKEATSTGETIEMHVPTVGESINEVTISSWVKKDGEIVQLDEVIAEIESDKATFELTAEATGKLQVIAKEGETLEIGALICKIEVMEGAVAKEEAKSPAPAAAPTTSGSSSYAAGHASPAAAKVMAEKGLSASDVKATGVDGRITQEDAMKAEKSAAPKSDAGKPATPSYAAPQIGGGVSRGQRREKMSSLRKTISRRLVSVKNETAMLTTFNEVNMGPVMELRKKYKDSFKEKYEVGLGFMSFFTKAITMALKEWPAVNAQIDGEEIVYNDYADVSIAVSTPKGLVVPVIRNAEALSFDQIEKEIVRLALKARDGKLSIDEMQGGTFTITNGGIFGSMLSTPIINAPQAAILGMHNIVERAVVENGQVVVRPIMYVALSYDHRIIDGRESVSFLVRVKQLLEDPSRLLLGV
ncbi:MULTISPECIES: 2-oxoglutarate dehydrogenase complex dihydrolipoyllysine-residue succinyltransferase [unclassified Imperialibacter]|uniref:2-oxoglutarate dehydrogenase complex dihydrolipoyllysine-residue succinyltransferase n=1 Tax=unclassified Imperialibacter TaxID=2629706 RepID=UPI00125BF3D7|nr:MULTISPECIES: 2-oxoglutarate dehydrogenase complex dihydrolipoyllysine-residue succinyltransferase [unclassified Imperialibacter]CAD5246694.1 dihydrolipoyltranssuccinase [Imperialibacter sp. 75]CAD5246755.1 dihydrolipoyltranssuccinase [Imperialibacter sp. 89]VVS96432.1 dihydrolipoyltranssuccinase [Imperialibacter sp. EC-SDR9]